jgi:hypothetical protein
MYCCWVLILYFSGCQKTLPFTLPKIHKSMSCYLSETCTAIDCCIDVEQISRSVNVYINLDACNYKLIAGIEKVTFDIPLLQYQFGQKQSFRLMNIFRIEWVINRDYINICGVGWMNYSKTCLNLTPVGPTFIFRIDRCPVYTG